MLLPFFAGACVNQNPVNNDGLVVKDMLNREVTVPKDVRKVVGLRAGALRLLIYCGAKDLIAGIEEPEKQNGKPYLDAFPGLKELPAIGPGMGGDAELILKVKPDVIFISYTTATDADALQQKTGIPVVAIECPEFATERDILFDSFRLIGKIINTEGHVESLISYITGSINELDQRTVNIPADQKPGVYIGGVPYSGSHGINSTQPYYPPFIFTNSRNVASSIDKNLISHVKGTFIDKEKLLQWDPGYIFIDHSGINLVLQELKPGSALSNMLGAVKNNRVYALYPYNNYAINYEMVLVNAWYVATVLYPEEFSDIDIAAKTMEILAAFFREKHAINYAGGYWRKLTKEDIQ